MASICPNRKNGKIVSFKFKACLGRDSTGRQIVRCTTWVPAKDLSERKMLTQAAKEAVIWEKQIAEERQENRSTQISFGDFVHRYWMPNQSNTYHRATTVEFYSHLLKVALPYFETKQLNQISSKDINIYFDYLRSTYRTKYNKQLAPKSLRHHYCLLNLIFKYANKLDFIDFNPLSKVDSPKLSRTSVNALSKSEVILFLQRIEDLQLWQKLIYTLILTTGMRRGECFGLQWKDVDLDNRILHIERNVTYTPVSGVTVGAPKTVTAIRTIPLSDRAVSLLIEYKQNEMNRISLKSNTFLFHYEDTPEEPRDPSYLTRHLKQFMKKIGLPDMSPHDLRHTCASLLVQSGADIKSVQDILGHSDASTTLNFYVKSNLDNMRTAVGKTFDF